MSIRSDIIEDATIALASRLSRVQEFETAAVHREREIEAQFFAQGLNKTPKFRGASNEFIWRSNRVHRLLWSGSSALRLAQRAHPFGLQILDRAKAGEGPFDHQIMLSLAGLVGMIRRADVHADWTMEAAGKNFPFMLANEMPAHLEKPPSDRDAEQAVWQGYAQIEADSGGEAVKSEIWVLHRQTALLGGFLRRERQWLQRELAELKEKERPKPATNAERVRQMRERKKAGFTHRISFDVHSRDIAALKRLGFIGSQYSPDEVEEGMKAFLQSALAMVEVDEDLNNMPEMAGDYGYYR